MSDRRLNQFEEIPKKMFAWTIRNDRLGQPKEALKKELIDIPEISANEVLVKNIVAGINYNAVWASMGHPKNVVKEQKKYGESCDFLIPGSESSSIVCRVGENVTHVKPGDEVICIPPQHDCGMDDDPRVDASFRVWGYETNWGAFAEYSKVQGRQCFLKPDYLSWEEAACCVGTGGTVYSMLTHFKENCIKVGDVVLIWGGAGGVGSSAIVLTKLLGGIPIAVVSSKEKEEECMNLGAKGCLNRTKYKHFGLADEEMYQDKAAYYKSVKSMLRMKKDLWNILGEKRDPDIVIEHPGMDTLPTSMFLCAKKGMVVTCGATSGYAGSLDLRHLWLGVKRLQGSHVLCDYEVTQYLELLSKHSIRIPIKERFSFDEVDIAHQRMYENKIEGGKMIIRIAS